MKYSLAIIILLSVSICHSQDYMQTIASKSCECLNTIKPSADRDKFNTELGLCMIDAAEPYKKELLRDYSIDFSKIDQHGEKLGGLIGTKMASICPNELISISAKLDELSSEENGKSIQGKIVAIEEVNFVTFTVLDKDNTKVKLYWLTPVTLYGKFENLSREYKLFLSEKANIIYEDQEFFDSEKKTYRKFKVIKSIKILD